MNEVNQLDRLNEIAQHLRRECPWDKQQTHQSLGRHLIEESYELIDAIDEQSDEPTQQSDEHLIEELGDLLFQVYAHCAIANETGRFGIADVAQNVADKLVARHPHVYGDVKAETAEDVMSTWESNKKKAKGRKSVMDGMPAQLPALMYASKVYRKAQVSGVDISQPDFPQGIGGELMKLVVEARRLGIDPELELRKTVNGLRERFETIEAIADAVKATSAIKETQNSKNDSKNLQSYWLESSGDTTSGN